MEYNLVVCGGTFEHLHKGHKAFLHFALSIGKKVLIGLTSDLYVQKIQKGTRLSFEQRKKTLENFLAKENVLERVEILPIDDNYIPREWEELPIEAIVATEGSLVGAQAINQKRKEKGQSKLRIILFPLIRLENGKPISSSSIRGSLSFSKTLFLPEDVRLELKKPLGKLITDFAAWVKKNRSNINPQQIITVGDVVTKTCNELSLGQQISIIDFFIGREKKFSDIKELGFSGNEQIERVSNKAGTLSSATFRKIKNLLTSKDDSRKILLIDGEEDLCVLPCVIFAPLGFLVFYGQPNEGVVSVEVLRGSKEKSRAFLARFLTY